LYKTKYASEISDDVTELGRKFIPKWGGCDRILVGFTITYAISAYHITTKVVILNPAHGEV